MASGSQKSLSSWLKLNPSTSGQSSNKRKQNEDNQTHEERLVKQRIYDREKRPPKYSKDA